MKTLIISLLLKFLTPKNIATIIAKCLASLLRHASKNGGDSWDTTKKIVEQTENWSHLFNEVYSDDELSREDEGKIASAIEVGTAISKISEIIKGK